MGGISLSREIHKSSPSFAIEKIIEVIYGELKPKNSVLILLFNDLQRIMNNNEIMIVLCILQNALIELNLERKNIMF